MMSLYCVFQPLKSVWNEGVRPADAPDEGM